MENINEEVNYMKYLFGYKKGIVISEQETTQSATTETKKNSVVGGVEIPGFTFVEDDLAWLTANPKHSDDTMSTENERRLEAYYGASPTSVGYNNLIGKYIIVFNGDANPAYTLKTTVLPFTFKIERVYKTDKNFPLEGNI